MEVETTGSKGAKFAVRAVFARRQYQLRTEAAPRPGQWGSSRPDAGSRSRRRSDRLLWLHCPVRPVLGGAPIGNRLQRTLRLGSRMLLPPLRIRLTIEHHQMPMQGITMRNTNARSQPCGRGGVQS
jgi:hypothetical protein